MADARVVSNFLVDLAEAEQNTLTPMQVLKLVYISHGYRLGAFGVPLISNRIEAWKFGPVIPSLYHAIKHWRDKPVGKVVVTSLPDLTEDEKAFVGQIYQAYKELDGIALSNLTHQPGTPWDEVYDPGVANLEIGDDLIQHHYREIMAA